MRTLVHWENYSQAKSCSPLLFPRRVAGVHRTIPRRLRLVFRFLIHSALPGEFAKIVLLALAVPFIDDEFLHGDFDGFF